MVSASEARPRPIDQVAADELGGEVLALRRTAAVAEPEDRAAGAQGFRHPGGDAFHLRHKGPERRHDFLMVVDSLLDVHKTLSTGALLWLRLATG